MITRYLLDTDALVDYLAGIADSVSLIQDLQHRGEHLCTCDIVIAEVYSGLRPGDRNRAQKLLGSLYFLSISQEAAMQAGEWRYAYARRGISLSTTDVLVAAAAYTYSAIIVTGNLNDYPMGEVSVLPLPRGKTKADS